MISTSRAFSVGPHSTGRPQRALTYLAKAVTWRASSRVWLAAYSCAPWSFSTWQRLADRFSAPCSPCRIDENERSADWLAKRTRAFQSVRWFDTRSEEHTSELQPQ